jgi:hypothetical protein
MALFSKSDDKKPKLDEAQLKRMEAEIQNREEEIAVREIRLNEQKASMAMHYEATEKGLAQREVEVLRKEQDLKAKELAAAAGFCQQQRETFRDVVESRITALDNRTAELNAFQDQIVLRLSEITSREGELKNREWSVSEREFKLEAGYTDKSNLLLESIKTREANCSNREENLRSKEAQLKEKYQFMLKRAEDVRRREEQVSKAEIERDGGFTEIRRQLDIELHGRKKSFEAEIAAERSARFAALELELNDDRSLKLEAIAKEVQAERERCRSDIDAEFRRLERHREKAAEEISAATQKLNDLRATLMAQEDDLGFREKLMLARDEKALQRSSSLDDEVEQQVKEMRQSFQARESVLETECRRLRESLTQTESLLGNYEELKRQLGDEPETVLLDLNAKIAELKHLKEKVLKLPREEMRQQFESLSTENERLLARAQEYEKSASELRMRLSAESELRAKLVETETQNRVLRSRSELLDTECNRLTEELTRLRAAYERKKDRDDRIGTIETPHYSKVLQIMQTDEVIDEIQWLEGIGKACNDYGLRFHPRILRSFHTALKTAEWAPITILAGVSGTGKSELPRLYAHFGGMPFLHLSVQPNWDSQESMLGFFNSVDNQFDAQPVLRFLAQSQKKSESGYPGLQDVICMVLLDEMNLAHAELYFAEFLSKLEYRRGLKGNDIPVLDVKLGAGVPPYQLPLGRNVLWAGTMNQDETTKSLSDKVLDRSIVIHFPRPTCLERRKSLKPLPQASSMLPRKVWEAWWSRMSDFSEDEVRPYKVFIENMNDALSKVGKALGHRVWQSIEYYMANYPEVRRARKAGDSQEMARGMRTAFEDQLVQKVMPKLRGIETRGRSKNECLDKIRAQLIDNGYTIVDDFDLSCEFGYGQFIWQSANFLREIEAGSTCPSDAMGSISEEEEPGVSPDAISA